MTCCSCLDVVVESQSSRPQRFSDESSRLLFFYDHDMPGGRLDHDQGYAVNSVIISKQSNGLASDDVLI